MSRSLVLSYYLPQFHEIKENNEWWGDGFTEWTCIKESLKYKRWQNIRQPHPDIGMYSLLDPAVMGRQYQIASKYAIDGFIVWDYWFGGGRRLLEKPMEVVLESNIDFKFCFCWANHSWFNKSKNILLMEQAYLGEGDYIEYFYKNLPYFKSKNYINFEGRLVFGIYNPREIPDIDVFASTFNRLARKHGLGEFIFFAENAGGSVDDVDFFDYRVDSAYVFKFRKLYFLSYIKEQLRRRFGFSFKAPAIYSYFLVLLGMAFKSYSKNELPVIVTGWDTSPRHKLGGVIYKGFGPRLFEAALRLAERQFKINKILIIKSWNEWAEGNVMEPDNVFGYTLLERFRAWRARVEAET